MDSSETQAMIVLPYPEKDTIDLLDRQEIMERLLLVSQILSENKKYACYAINGKWGSGKTFVLDMFQKKALEIYQDGTTLPRFLVFRYNCWEYDFYEEPLIAIVASLKEQLDIQVRLLSQDTRAKLGRILTETLNVLTKSALEIASMYTKVPLREMYEIFKKDATQKEDHSFDQYFGFRRQLRELRKALEKLAAEQSIIFVVDELDRCLPSYTIKVLERLHHLFAEIPNIQVIIAVDKEQLMHSIRQIYGESLDVDGYLRKFIGFELLLDEGKISEEEQFDMILKEYASLFTHTRDIIKKEDVSQYKTYILDDLNMRKRISLVKKCELLHSILYDEYAKDTSYMCLELFLTLLYDCDIDMEHAKRSFQIDNLFDAQRLWTVEQRKTVPAGLTNLSSSISKDNNGEWSNILWKDSRGRYSINSASLYGQIVMVYRRILGYENDHILNQDEDTPRFLEYGMKYWNLLHAIH